MNEIYCLKNGKVETSDWFLKTFAECELKAYFQSVLGIEPRDLPADSPLTIGDAFHESMETVHAEQQAGLQPMQWTEVIDRHFGSHRSRFSGGSTHPRDVWGATFACWLERMILAYLERWPSDRWAESYPETWFRQPILHPELGIQVDSVTHKGAVDLLVRSDRSFVWGKGSDRFRLPAQCEQGWYLKELKTAAKVDDAYVGKLVADDQITMYAHYLGVERGITIEGILYDVTIKPPKKSHQLHPDETGELFQRRKRKAETEAKQGRMGNRLRQKIGETKEQLQVRKIQKGMNEVQSMAPIRRTDINGFAAKLAAFYRKPDRFVRVFVPLQPQITRTKLLDQYHRAIRVRDAVDSIREGAQPSDIFIRNWSSCWPQKGRCEFWSVCTSSRPDEVLSENFVRRKARKTADRHIMKELIATAPDADEDF